MVPTDASSGLKTEVGDESPQDCNFFQDSIGRTDVTMLTGGALQDLIPSIRMCVERQTLLIEMSGEIAYAAVCYLRTWIENRMSSTPNGMWTVEICSLGPNLDDYQWIRQQWMIEALAQIVGSLPSPHADIPVYSRDVLPRHVRLLKELQAELTPLFQELDDIYRALKVN